VALEWDGDDGVWAGLEGDVDTLSTIARAIPEVSQRLNLYVDRRRFRPFVRLGTVTDDTTVPYLEQLLADLAAYRSPWWVQQTLPVWQLTGAGTGPRFKLVDEVPLGG
jgi:hypothetical protein